MLSGNGNGKVDACVGEASGISDEEVCVGDDDACKGEASVVLSGKSRYAVKRRGTAEYPCVKRLRERRLLSFLQDQGFHGAFEALVDKTPVIFRVRHIRLLVEQGRWADALSYLNAYLPPLVKNHTRSRRAQLFHNFLWMHYRFANAVAGNRENQDYLERRYGKNSRSSTLAELRFRRIAYTILASEPHQLVATYDWNQVRQHASFLVDYLANTTPELRRSMPLPSRYMMPQHVLPIGSGRLHWRGHRLVKKQGPKKPDTKAILVALKSLYRDPRAESNNDALEMLVDLLDQTFQAGLRRGCNLSYASQPSVKEGGPDAPDVESMLGSSTDNPEGHATSSVLFSVSPFFQIRSSGALEVRSQNPGISSGTDAGGPDARDVQSMLGSSKDNAEGHGTSPVKFSVAPVLKIISGALKVHSQNPGISSVMNAGTNKGLIQGGSHTENPSKGSTTVEDDIYSKKKQRTTGAFGEGSSVSTIAGRASTDTLVNVMPKLSRVSSF